jgi:hypothetical protein
LGDEGKAVGWLVFADGCPYGNGRDAFFAATSPA